MGEIFKTRINPDNKQLVDDNNTVFVSSIVGSDNNMGKRNSPYKSIMNSMGKGCVIKGKFLRETVQPYSTIIGEDYPYFEEILISYTNTCYYLNINKAVIDYSYGKIYYSKINLFENIVIGDQYNAVLKYSYINTYNLSCLGSNDNFSNNTIVKYYNNIQTKTANLCYNSLFVEYLELYGIIQNLNRNDTTFIPLFKNCVFLKSTQFKWKGNIIAISYSNNPLNYRNDLITSLSAFADTISNPQEKAYLQAIIANSFDINCKIVDDAAHVVFNAYDADGNITDYSLKLSSNNPALFASTSANYVGAYKAALSFVDGIIKDVDVNGVNTATVPDFLIKNADGTFTTNINATQLWNRAEFPVEHFPRGFSFEGFQSNFVSGLDGRVCLGKRQILDQNNVPQESIEIFPYDSETTSSTQYPPFSANINGSTQMFYNATTGAPIKFNDLAALGITTSKNLTLYGNYGVTTADYESYLLSGLANVVAKKILIYYFRKQINIHYAP